MILQEFSNIFALNAIVKHFLNKIFVNIDSLILNYNLPNPSHQLVGIPPNSFQSIPARNLLLYINDFLFSILHQLTLYVPSNNVREKLLLLPTVPITPTQETMPLLSSGSTTKNIYEIG